MRRIVLILTFLLMILLVGCTRETMEKKRPIENVEEEKSEQYIKTEEQDENALTEEIVSNETSSESVENSTDDKNEVETIREPIIKDEVTDDVSSKKEEKKENDKDNESAHNTVVSYNPQRVVTLATSQLKAQGKILLTDNLDRLLKEGLITQAEYNEYYPYDGAGYYSVFMETNLNDAKTTSGRKLNSEEDIARYIADMLAVENGPYFLIEYVGVYTTNGDDFYEFRCYRA